MTFTVFGASGFIGSNLVQSLQSESLACWTPRRGENGLDRPLGHAIYCIGLTADFRQRPYDTVRAHVCHLVDILEKAEFDSFLYLSTTRVYSGSSSSHENTTLIANPGQPGDLYNISKIAGESLSLSCGRANVRVARLSNVIGRDFSSENFLSSVIRDAVKNGKVVLRSSVRSEKDYIAIDDVVRLLPLIAQRGKQRIYNVASGSNTSNGAILEEVQRVTGCAVEVTPDAPTLTFPPIDTERIRTEFGSVPTRILDSLEELVVEHRKKVDSVD